MQAMKELPQFVRIVVQPHDEGDKMVVGDGCEIRFMPGTVAEVVAALFGEKPQKLRRKRRTKVQIEAEKHKPDLAADPAPEPETKPRKRKEKVWPQAD